MSFTQEVFRSSSEAGVLDICINVPNDFQYERPVIYQLQVLPGGTTGQTLQLDVTGFEMPGGGGGLTGYNLVGRGDFCHQNFIVYANRVFPPKLWGGGECRDPLSMKHYSTALQPHCMLHQKGNVL